MVKRVYGHLGQARRRAQMVEYRVEEHRKVLGDRLTAVRQGCRGYYRFCYCAETCRVTSCASRDSNAGPSAPEASTAGDHQRWPLSFQALTRVARRPAPASDGPVVTTVVTAGRFSVAVLEQRPPVRDHVGPRRDLPVSRACQPSMRLSRGRRLIWRRVPTTQSVHQRV